MNGQTAKHAGIALAALLQGDRALGEAGHGFDEALASELTRAILPNDEDGRRHHIGALLARVRPPLDGRVADLPPRLLALVVRRLPTEVGRAMLREGTRPRAGFTLAADLAPRLLRIARHHQEHARP